MLWLSGPAGTGKSAVAQTFAELCVARCRLGAAYFFSRANGRDDPKSVVPTIAYQLSVYFPEYRTLLTNRIASDLTIFQRTPRAQLMRLIIEPLTTLQERGYFVTREPLVIILDGLDECQGVNAQCEIVEMIGDILRSRKNLPLLWLICSRPEPHLKYIFSRADFAIDCDREKLLIDADTRDDVGRYLRDGFKDIRARFWDVTDASWPSDTQLNKVEDISSGLFVLAFTILGYVGDPEHADPIKRLAEFLTFMENGGRVGADNPLETLDLLYSRILSKIPQEVFPVTRRILCFCTYSRLRAKPFTAQALCNLLNLEQREFYTSLRALHSLIEIPSPEAAATVSLKMYHTSFKDYLESSTRSGRFFVSEQEACFESSSLGLLWYGIIQDFGIFDGMCPKNPDSLISLTSLLQVPIGTGSELPIASCQT